MVNKIKRHLGLVILLIIVLVFPTSMSYQARLNMRIIVTGLAIDKIDGEYLWGIIDNHGRELVPPKFKSISTIGARSNYIWLNLNTEEKKYRLNISRLSWCHNWSHAIDMEDNSRHYEYDDDNDYSYKRS